MHRFFAILLLAVVSLLSGCTVRSADELYRLPKRSEEFNDLQSAMDSAMAGLEYCAPVSGDSQQAVQMADVNGDGAQEALVFARSKDTKQLKILVFSRQNGCYSLVSTLESSGSDFDQVEYVPMDGQPGLEIVVGYRVGDQVLRAVTVYGFRQGEFVQLLTVSYSKYVTCDLNADGSMELFVLHPGMTDSDNGVVEWYSYADGEFERSTEVNISGPMDRMKRVMTSSLQGGVPGVYVASAVGEDGIITDVFALSNGRLTNVSLSNESGTSVQTLRNYYLYGDDIDNDGIMELPSLIFMRSLNGEEAEGRQSLIRWYAMTVEGGEVDKLYTYHNFAEGWYLSLEQSWINRITVIQNSDGSTAVYLWDWTGETAKRLVTLFVLTGEDRSVEASLDNRIVLAKTDTVVYAAALEPAASELGLTRENLADRFHLISMDWKTGET